MEVSQVAVVGEVGEAVPAGGVGYVGAFRRDQRG